MDIQAYISSGILELYVIGQLSPREMREVEQMAAQHPAVKKELTAIEQALESYSLKNQTATSTNTFEKIKTEIQANPVRNTATTKQPKSLLLPILTLVALLLGIGLLMLLNNNNRLKVEKAVAEAALVDCETENQTLQQETQGPMAILRQAGTCTILLEGTAAVPNAKAAVYFNPIAQKTYLDPFQLATPETGKQYQLWALIGGQPTDMGVFNAPAAGEVFIEVPFIAAAEAFAITLEPAGGSTAPTLTDLQVLGNRS